MSLPIVGQENATQIWMFVKDDSKQIESFALVPVRSAPDSSDCGHMRVIFIKQNLEPQAMKLSGRKQVIVHLEARFCFGPSIKSADVRQKIELQPRILFKKMAGRDDVFTRNNDCGFTQGLNLMRDPFRMLTL